MRGKGLLMIVFEGTVEEGRRKEQLKLVDGIKTGRYKKQGTARTVTDDSSNRTCQLSEYHGMMDR